MLMTLEQMIDALSNTAAVIGPKAEVQAWNVSTAAGTQPLDAFHTTCVSAGWDQAKKQPVALIKIAR